MKSNFPKSPQNDEDARRQKENEEPDYYINEKGLLVFTRRYHLKRGYCCKSGCLHCPYGYRRKPE